MEPFAAGTIVAQRYRILREIGRGGMGVVYRVEHVHTGQEHALKVLNVHSGLSAELVLRFKREARAPARIKSEHVVTVTDADVMPERSGTPFLVMELLDGTDLERVLDERERLTPREVVDTLEQVARVLDKAHALGIVHRDLKPENLFFHRREDGTTILKVLDFGISKVLEREDGDPVAGLALTRPGSLMGTPLYMSPEQAGAGGSVGPQSDVWALGIVAIRLLTGEYYWRAQSMGEMMAQLLRDPLYPPRERWPWLPEGFDEWFARACARDPAQRFTRVSEQVQALAAVLGETVDLRRPSSIPSLTTTTARQSERAATVNELGATTPVDSADLPIADTGSSPKRSRGRAVAVGAALGLACVSVAAYAMVTRDGGKAPLVEPSANASASVVAPPVPASVPAPSTPAPVASEAPPAPSASVPPRMDASVTRVVPLRRDSGAPGAPAVPTATTHNPVAP